MRIHLSKPVIIGMIIVGIAVLLIAIQFSNNGGFCIAQADIKTQLIGNWNTSGPPFARTVGFINDNHGIMDDDEGFSYGWTADEHLLLMGETYEVSGCGDELILKSSRGMKVVLRRQGT